MEAEIEIGDVYMFKKLFGQLQRIGKALMLPVAILPAAGILLAFGNAMQRTISRNCTMVKKRYHCNDFVGHGTAGQVVFDNLPLLFAVGTALGLAGGDGVDSICQLSRLLNYGCNNGESVAYYN